MTIRARRATPPLVLGRKAIRAGTALVAIGAVLLSGAVPPAAAHTATRSRHLAREVCEDMVRDSVVAAAREPLSQPQQGSWTGTRYSCRYTFATGSLAVEVAVYRKPSAAKHAFTAAQRTTTERSRLYGVGQQAFQEQTTRRLVARKDNFLLTVDPTRLGALLDHDTIAWSATRAIFACW
jgi:hypothetical protein